MMNISGIARFAYLSTAFAIIVHDAPSAIAGEGGGSHFLQATVGDFQAAVWGPAGFYARNNLFYDTATIGPRPLGGRVAIGVHQQAWVNSLGLAYLTDYTFLGARVGAAVSFPYLLNGHVSGSGVIPAGAFGIFKAGDVQGLGDIYVSPVQLNWTNGNHHFVFAPAVYAKTGKYDVDNLLNVGRNYWSFDLAGRYTWFDPSIGIDVSVTAGLMLNTRNQATNYRSGTEFHLDWTIAKFLSQTFAVGVTGYFYQQLDGDFGTVAGGLVDVSNYRGRGAGFGPAVLVSIPITGGTPLTFIGKAVFDVDNNGKRFDGNLYMLSLAKKLL